MNRRRTACCYLAAPLVTGLFLLPVFWRWGLYPLGDNTLAWCDMRQQVVPLWMQLKDILSGEVSPFYSFRAAGGMNLWGVLFFFVASPLSLLVGLWDKEELLVFANLITVLKMMLCSLSALCYFRRRHPRLDETCGVLLAVCYAMSGYAMMYYQNSIWLDVMALFPLLYLSMERLQQPGGGSGYSLLLALTIVVNYYISYAVLLFLLFAAAVNCLVRLEPSARGKFALRLGGRTAFGLGLAAPVWLPSLLEVMASARTDNVFDSVAGGAMLTNFFTTLPLFYCTAVLFAALPSAVKRAFWPLRRLPDAPGDQRLRADLLLFVLMMLPVMLDPINKLWHTGSYQAFPVRYGFIPVLLGLSIFAAMLEPQEQEGVSTPAALGGASAALGVALAISGVLVASYYKPLTVYIRRLWGDRNSFVLLSVWAAAIVGAMWVLLRYRRRGALGHRAFCGFFAGLIAVQTIFSGAVYLGGASQPTAWLHWISDLEDRIPDEQFYRVKTSGKLFDVNLIGGLGYNTLAHYTSLTREEFLFGIKKMGYSAYWMESGSHGGTLLTDALLQNRYTITSGSARGAFAREVYHNRGYRIMESGFTLPFGLVTDASPEELSEMPVLERANVGEWMLQLLLDSDQRLVTQYQPTGSEHLTLERGMRTTVTPKKGTKATLRYLIEIDRPTMLYLDCFDQASTRLTERVNGSLSVKVNGIQKAASYPSQRENGLLELGYFEGGTVEVTLGVNQAFSAKSFGVFGVDTDALSETLQTARGAELTAGGRQIAGSAQAERDGELLFVPVPYAEGWRATVNQTETPVLRAFGCWMAVELQQGDNQIELTFFPGGMAEAFVLFFLALAAALLLKRWPLHKKIAQRAERAAAASLLLCAAAALLAVYLLPMMIKMLS